MRYVSTLNNRGGVVANSLFVFFLLLSLDFFDCIPIKEKISLPIVRQVLGVVLSVITIPVLLDKRKCIFRNEYLLILLSFLLCSISSNILYNQSFFESFKCVANYVFALSIYLFALEFRIREDFVFKVLLFLSCASLIILIYQQFTYPDYIFCGRVEQEWQKTLEIRMGLYRFSIHGIWLSVLCLMLIYHKLVYSKADIFMYILFFIAVFVNIVFNLERKVLFSCLASIIVGVIFVRGKFSIQKVVLSGFLIGVFTILPDYLGDLNRQTEQELSDSDFIRFVAMKYFLFDMNSSPLYYLFGAGIPGASPLGKFLDNIEYLYHFYSEDVGLVGYMSKVGILGLISYFLIIFKIIKMKKWVKQGLILFLLALLLVCIFKFWGNHPSNIAAFAVFMYLVNCSVRYRTI